MINHIIWNIKWSLGFNVPYVFCFSCILSLCLMSPMTSLMSSEIFLFGDLNALFSFSSHFEILEVFRYKYRSVNSVLLAFFMLPAMLSKRRTWCCSTLSPPSFKVPTLDRWLMSSSSVELNSHREDVRVPNVRSKTDSLHIFQLTWNIFSYSLVKFWESRFRDVFLNCSMKRLNPTFWWLMDHWGSSSFMWRVFKYTVHTVHVTVLLEGLSGVKYMDLQMTNMLCLSSSLLL